MAKKKTAPTKPPHRVRLRSSEVQGWPSLGLIAAQMSRVWNQVTAKMPTPLAWIDDELERLVAAGLRRRLVTRRGPQGGTIAIEPAESLDEKNPAAAAGELLNFGSNDYLGLAADPRLADAAAEAAQAEGWGAGASPLVTGHSTSHRRLEARLAEFLGTEAALVFPSGFAANSGAIAVLVGRGDVVLGDQKNHASLIDGCRLSRAEVLIYPHRDIDKLDAMLRASTAYRRRLIATDTLFSMDGDIAPARPIGRTCAAAQCDAAR